MARTCRKRQRARIGGFTLIELLVVILIIGIVLSFVSLSIDTNDKAQRLEREAHRLDALLHTATTVALLHGTNLGLDITPHGYRFVRLTDKGWQVIDGDRPLRPRRLDDDMALVALTLDQDEHRRLVASADDDAHDDDKAHRRRPEALFLSSGEVIPFVLELHAPGVQRRYRLVGQADGDIQLKHVGSPS